MTTKLNKIVAEAVRKGVSAAYQESSAPKAKITTTQLREAIVKAVRAKLAEDMGATSPPPPSPAGGSSTMEEEGVMTPGTIPVAEELQEAITEQGGWNMDLSGNDRKVFEMALEAVQIHPHNASHLMQTGEGMHRVISALLESKNQTAIRLAGTIVETLGWEWV